MQRDVPDHDLPIGSPARQPAEEQYGQSILALIAGSKTSTKPSNQCYQVLHHCTASGEPGGGGYYIAQRMLAARNEKQAMAATLWFNIAHYALRPWPWIIVALASLIVYPELSDIEARFPDVDPSIIRHDLAYPAMLVFVPHGLLGLVVASLAAAYMSTISTHLNWGASLTTSIAASSRRMHPSPTTSMSAGA